MFQYGRLSAVGFHDDEVPRGGAEKGLWTFWRISRRWPFEVA